MTYKNVIYIALIVSIFLFLQSSSGTSSLNDSVIKISQDKSSDQLSNSSWPKFRHDAQNSGQSPYNGPKTYQIKWIFKTSLPISSSPAIGSDGTVYFGTGTKFDNAINYFFAVDSFGKIKWKYKTTGPISGSPAIGSDGNIYLASNDLKIYSFKPSGNLNWACEIGSDLNSSPAIGRDGTIYIGSGSGGYVKYSFHAVNPMNGNPKWELDAGRCVESCPAISSDGSIYLGSIDHNLYALTSDGKLKWKYLTGGSIYSSPTLHRGVIYFGSNDGYLYAINSNGRLLWKYRTSGNIVSSPAIGTDGTIYFGSWDRNFYALTSLGNLKWKFSVRNIIDSSPALSKDGIIYFGCSDTYFYALTNEGKLKFKYKTGDEIISSPSISKEGIIYFGSSDGHLYALQDLFKTINPSNGAIKVPINKEIKLTFNSFIKASTSFNNISIKTKAGKNVLITKSIYQNYLVIKKRNGFYQPLTKYYIHIPLNSVKTCTGFNLISGVKSYFTTIGPNIIVTKITAPSSGKRGYQLKVPNIVKNVGTGAGRNFYIKYYLTPYRNLSKKYLIGQRLINFLATNKYNYNITICNVNKIILPGNYYLAAFTPQNNVGYSKTRISIK